jgi:hypothetical protein
MSSWLREMGAVRETVALTVVIAISFCNKVHAIKVSKLPYSPLSIGRAPSSESAIWRFMSFAKFYSLLSNGAVYFAVLSSLGDVLEAAPPRLPKDADVYDRMRVWHRWQSQRQMVFVNCWHLSPDESAAMWALYATESDGVAIQSTFGEASQAFGSSEGGGRLGETVGASEVEYIDPDVEVSPETGSNIVLPALKKRHWYAYERELRFIYVDVSNYLRPLSGPDCAAGRAARLGLWIRCDLQKLIKAVVLAPSTPPFIADTVASACRQFAIDPALLRRSRLCEGAPEPPDEGEWQRYLQTLREKLGRPFGITY